MRIVTQSRLIAIVSTFLSFATCAAQQDSNQVRTSPGTTVITNNRGDQSVPPGYVDATPTIGASPIRIETVTFPEQRYRLIELFPGLWYWHCDPDGIPSFSLDRLRSRAIQAFPAILRDHTGLEVMERYLGLDKVSEFSDDQKVLLYREYEKLMEITLESQGGTLKFILRSLDPPKRGGSRDNGHEIIGSIDPDGKICILESTPIFLSCPLCLAGGTRIDTPAGQIAVQDLKPGMLVWTVDSQNVRVAVPVLKVSSVPVPSSHMVVHLLLNDGRELRVSPGHPTVDGNVVGKLEPCGVYDGAGIRSVSLERYENSDRRTFDILPAGDTGFYWANGILLASTLR